MATTANQSAPPFATAFEAVFGFPPLGWQCRLFDRFVANDLPAACDLPTGLGKTSVIAIWAIAVATQASRGGVTLPRRLVYVVNRRTVVDQATDDALRLREALRGPVLADVRRALASLCVDPSDEASPLAVSTLRGELADNREWQADPARPAVIVGTVDMIGSRLLFSGYGRVGWKMRAFHAGLVGHDALLVHDEAHLTPPFGALVRELARVQRQDREPRPLRVLDLSATQRGGADSDVFALLPEEREEPVVRRRVLAKKSLSVGSVPEPVDVPKRIARAALAHRDEAARVLVYVRSPETAKEVVDLVAKELRGKKDRVALLTGTLRGHERDALSGSVVFTAFKADEKRAPLEHCVFLVSTSAGEVGANLDADHLVCDMATLDSMVQRFGRVNRLGRDDDGFVATVDVVDAPAPKRKGKADDDAGPSAYEAARAATRDALHRLPDRGAAIDASPDALRTVLTPATIASAFAPSPRIVPCTDILLDNWALTSIRDELPGRPTVAPWLHGVQTEPPETTVVWRDEAAGLAAFLDVGGDVEQLRDRKRRPGSASRADAVEEWFSQHRIESRERLRDSSERVLRELRAMSERIAEGQEHRVLVIRSSGVESRSLFDITTEDIEDGTVVVPAEAGGLDEQGLLNGRCADHALDVAEPPGTESPVARIRVRAHWDGDADAWDLKALGHAADSLAADLAAAAVTAARRSDTLSDAVLGGLNAKRNTAQALLAKMQVVLAADEDGPTDVLLAFAEARRAETAIETSSTAPSTQTLRDHLAWAGVAAERLASRLGLPPDVASAVVIAARWHDAGKARRSWQRAVGHPPPRTPDPGWEPWAKTRHGRFDFTACPGYRHELGSVIEASADEGVIAHPDADLLLHLIASHHGRARPHFTEEAFDPEASDDANVVAANATVSRYAKLQRRYGRWGLAWLEAILKCADVIATIEGPRAEALPP